MLHSSWRTSLSCPSMAKKIRYNLNKLGKQIVTPEADWFLYNSIVQCYPEILEQPAPKAKKLVPDTKH